MRLTKTLRAMVRAATLGATAVLISGAAHAATASNARTGRLAAMRFFFHYELPKIGAWLQVVSTRDATCASFPEEAF